MFPLFLSLGLSPHDVYSLRISLRLLFIIYIIIDSLRQYASQLIGFLGSLHQTNTTITFWLLQDITLFDIRFQPTTFLWFTMYHWLIFISAVTSMAHSCQQSANGGTQFSYSHYRRHRRRRNFSRRRRHHWLSLIYSAALFFSACQRLRAGRAATRGFLILIFRFYRLILLSRSVNLLCTYDSISQRYRHKYVHRRWFIDDDLLFYFFWFSFWLFYIFAMKWQILLTTHTSLFDVASDYFHITVSFLPGFSFE